MNKLIEMTGVTKEYELGETIVHALRGVNISIERGEFVSIVGPSGSGKSTLMHIIGCLDVPSQGMYFLQGSKVNDMDDDELADIRKELVGFVFQDFYLMADVPAWYNVSLPMIYNRIPPDERKNRSIKLLEDVGLGDRINHMPNQLSGGERQRVTIARALANKPEIILADEPTGNLDSKTGKGIMEIFQKLNSEGKTIVFVTHELYVANQAEKKISLRDGHIVKNGD